MSQKIREDASNIRKLIREAEAVSDEVLIACARLKQAMVRARMNPQVTGSGAPGAGSRPPVTERSGRSETPSCRSPGVDLRGARIGSTPRPVPGPQHRRSSPPVARRIPDGRARTTTEEYDRTVSELASERTSTAAPRTGPTSASEERP